MPSLLELYRQLDEDDAQCTLEQSQKIWKEIEDNANIQYFGAIEQGKVVSTCYAVYIPNLTRGNRYESAIITTDNEVYHSLLVQFRDLMSSHSVPLKELFQSKLCPSEYT